MKIRPVKAELFHAETHKDIQTERQTEWRDETNSRFSRYCEKRR